MVIEERTRGGRVESCSRNSGTPASSNEVSYPSRIAISITACSASTRRATNPSTAQLGSSSHWASSTRTRTGRGVPNQLERREPDQEQLRGALLQTCRIQPATHRADEQAALWPVRGSVAEADADRQTEAVLPTAPRLWTAPGSRDPSPARRPQQARRTCRFLARHARARRRRGSGFLRRDPRPRRARTHAHTRHVPARRSIRASRIAKHLRSIGPHPD